VNGIRQEREKESREMTRKQNYRQAAEGKFKSQGKSDRRMTMQSKLPLLVLSLVLGSGLSWAAPPTTGSQATASIQSRLDHATLNKHGDVQVTYAGGVATLTGTVDNLGSKLDVEKAAQKTPGVTRVVDNIQVRAEGVGDPQILEQARHDIVMYYAYGIFDDVYLEAHNGTLVVSGEVTQPFKKTDMGRILGRVRGVAVLQNNLEILPLSTFDDRLRLQVARAIYGDPFFIRYANQALPPIHIIVKNGNVTLEGVVNSTMDRTKAEMAALHAGLAFSIVDNLRMEKS
jgi:hyperosmotically inducible protein